MALHTDGGGGGIRTHGPVKDSGFQDRPVRPLQHPSGMHPLLRGFFDQEPTMLFHADLVTCVTFESGHARVVFAFGAYAFKFTGT